MRRAGGSAQPKARRTNEDALRDRRARDAAGDAAEGTGGPPDEPHGVLLSRAHTERVVGLVDDYYFGLAHGIDPCPSFRVEETPNNSLLVWFRESTSRPVIVEIKLRNPLRATLVATTFLEAVSTLRWADGGLPIESFAWDRLHKRAPSKQQAHDALLDMRGVSASIYEVIGLLTDEPLLPMSEVVSATAYVFSDQPVAGDRS